MALWDAQGRRRATRAFVYISTENPKPETHRPTGRPKKTETRNPPTHFRRFPPKKTQSYRPARIKRRPAVAVVLIPWLQQYKYLPDEDDGCFFRCSTAHRRRSDFGSRMQPERRTEGRQNLCMRCTLERRKLREVRYRSEEERLAPVLRLCTKRDIMGVRQPLDLPLFRFL